MNKVSCFYLIFLVKNSGNKQKEFAKRSVCRGENHHINLDRCEGQMSSDK
jgi:hypothetical protein